MHHNLGPHLKNFLLVLPAVFGLFLCSSLQAQTVLFSEGWETPVITSPPVEAFGTFIPTDRSLPLGWTDLDSGASLNYLLAQPQTSQFSESLPFAAPAGGSQALVINRASATAGVAFATEAILGNTEYTLSAAIGSSLNDLETSDNWLLRLWADTTENNALDPNDDTLLGQLFGNQAEAINPANGEWALNSFSVNSNDTPDLLGTNLLVSISTFTGGIAYFDNVSVTATSIAGIPEPNTMFLTILAGGVLTLVRRRK